ncbi:NAD(P)-dependent oxidoreductase [Granulicella sp. L60]|uniref:NAD-dependent epimerase/dehydratase family protein n=1 Tax=Granulicella sp. L60 TaxID=1641866 RepID=UPI00131D9A8F|nr:NAD(P)-dependent oxidoreductase [Granulicella sp. L60]
MKIFVAGASGAIGQPLIAELIRHGHTVTGMTQSEAGARRLTDQGAAAQIADAFDASAVEQALRRSEPEIIIDELTALPKHPADLPKYAPGDRKLRLEGGGNLHRAAQACGVRRYIQQSSGFFLHPGEGLADESVGLATDATPGVAASAQTYADLEARILNSNPMEGVSLRYGFFYGPNTWYHPEGGAADQVRKKQFPLVGQAQGVWSFVHIEDAAIATVAALTAEPGIYNIVDDDPSPVSRWLPPFAKWVGAPPPSTVPEVMARMVAGPDAVYYSTKLRGASNEKARKTLNFRPRPLQWLHEPEA